MMYMNIFEFYVRMWEVSPRMHCIYDALLGISGLSSLCFRVICTSEACSFPVENVLGEGDTFYGK